MENLNTERKSIDELVKEADEKKMKVVIIGAGEVGAIVERTIANEHFMCVHVANLNQEDQDKINRANEKDPFAPEPIVFSAPPPLPEIKLDSYKIDSEPFTGLGRNKFKGYRK